MFKNGTILDKRYQIQAHLGTGGSGRSLSGFRPGSRPGVRAQNFEYNGGSEGCASPFSQRVSSVEPIPAPAPGPHVCLGLCRRIVPILQWNIYPGKTLEKIIADQALLARFRASHFFALVQQLAEGLAYIHTQGAVHRDLKPSNIMVLETEEGIETTILDMGLAKLRHLHSVSITQTGAAIGTAEYMSPEQGKGLWVDHRSDLYSLGIILYEMLTGAPPFSGQNPISVIMKHIRESPPPMGRSSISLIPEQTQQIVLKLLAKEPVDRYQSAEEVFTMPYHRRFVLPG